MKLHWMAFGAALAGLWSAPALAARQRTSEDRPDRRQDGAARSVRQTNIGRFRHGPRYATGGTWKVAGRKLVVIEKDSQTKPDVGRNLLNEAYNDDGADIAVGGTSSAVALAMLPVAHDNKKVFVVEPAVADSITGDKWNRYIFRTVPQLDPGCGVERAGHRQTRHVGGDACPGLCVRPRFRHRIPHRARSDRRQARVRGICAAGHDRLHRVVSAHLRRARQGAGPQDHLSSTGPAAATRCRRSRRSIRNDWESEISTGGNILPALAAYKDFPGLEGAAYYVL